MAAWTLCSLAVYAERTDDHQFVTTRRHTQCSSLAVFLCRSRSFFTGHCSRLAPSVVSTRFTHVPTVRYSSTTLLSFAEVIRFVNCHLVVCPYYYISVHFFHAMKLFECANSFCTYHFCIKLIWRDKRKEGRPIWLDAVSWATKWAE